jgi:hypothetical protein
LVATVSGKRSSAVMETATIEPGGIEQLGLNRCI